MKKQYSILTVLFLLFAIHANTEGRSKTGLSCTAVHTAYPAKVAPVPIDTL